MIGTSIDFGRNCLVFREAVVEATDLETVISGYRLPVGRPVPAVWNFPN
jgi:hypothetical protein